jgi:hypothetical protein
MLLVGAQVGHDDDRDVSEIGGIGATVSLAVGKGERLARHEEISLGKLLNIII